jgi:hypothetical protein
MDRSDEITRSITNATTHAPATCLAPGCPCRDARIVSRRRASFFAFLARERGETASRVVRPQPGWRLPDPG